MNDGETIRRYADAWLAGDTATMGSIMADDVSLHLFGHSPLAGTHRGKATVFEVIGKVQLLTNRKTIEIHDVLVGRDHAAILVRERFENSQGTLDLDRVFLYHLRDDRITDIYVYDEDQTAVDTFWS